MNSKENSLKIKALLISGLLGTAMATQASVISVNFQGGGNPATGPDVTGTAGYVPAGNWSNATGISGTGLALDNDSGDNSGASVSWTTFNLWDEANGDGNGGDVDMMSGFLDNWQTGTGAITVSGISYAQYDVYVYFNRTSETYLGATASDGSESQTYYARHDGSTYTSGAGYTISEDDNVADGWTDANVFKFSGFTGGTFTLDDAANPGAPASPGGYKMIVNGIQIVAVPEPSSTALLGLGGLALLMRRRK